MTLRLQSAVDQVFLHFYSSLTQSVTVVFHQPKLYSCLVTHNYLVTMLRPHKWWIQKKLWNLIIIITVEITSAAAPDNYRQYSSIVCPANAPIMAAGLGLSQPSWVEQKAEDQNKWPVLLHKKTSINMLPLLRPSSQFAFEWPHRNRLTSGENVKNPVLASTLAVFHF